MRKNRSAQRARAPCSKWPAAGSAHHPSAVREEQICCTQELPRKRPHQRRPAARAVRRIYVRLVGAYPRQRHPGTVRAWRADRAGPRYRCLSDALDPGYIAYVVHQHALPRPPTRKARPRSQNPALLNRRLSLGGPLWAQTVPAGPMLVVSNQAVTATGMTSGGTSPHFPGP
jgi:hypothetical protein